VPFLFYLMMYCRQVMASLVYGLLELGDRLELSFIPPG